jgi:hypothetical protein
LARGCRAVDSGALRRGCIGRVGKTARTPKPGSSLRVARNPAAGIDSTSAFGRARRSRTARPVAHSATRHGAAVRHKTRLGPVCGRVGELAGMGWGKWFGMSEEKFVGLVTGFSSPSFLGWKAVPALARGAIGLCRSKGPVRVKAKAVRPTRTGWRSRSRPYYLRRVRTSGGKGLRQGERSLATHRPHPEAKQRCH